MIWKKKKIKFKPRIKLNNNTTWGDFKRCVPLWTVLVIQFLALQELNLKFERHMGKDNIQTLRK